MVVTPHPQATVTGLAQPTAGLLTEAMAELARSRSPRGELVLRERDTDGAVELRVNGVFVMDDSETSSERALARAALAALPDDPPRGLPDGISVLVGGLGLGFTLREVLADERVRRVVVAEIEPDLVAWHRAGLVQPRGLGSGLEDPRTELAVGDVRDIVRDTPAHSVDVLLLDVDNGPGYLVYDDNAALYGEAFTVECRDRLRPGGILAVWSAAPAPTLLTLFERVFESAADHPIPVLLGERHTTYHLVVGHA